MDYYIDGKREKVVVVLQLEGDQNAKKKEKEKRMKIEQKLTVLTI